MANLDNLWCEIENTKEDLEWAKAGAAQHDGENESRNAEVLRLETKLAGLRRMWREVEAS